MKANGTKLGQGRGEGQGIGWSKREYHSEISSITEVSYWRGSAQLNPMVCGVILAIPFINLSVAI